MEPKKKKGGDVFIGGGKKGVAQAGREKGGGMLEYGQATLLPCEKEKKTWVVWEKKGGGRDTASRQGGGGVARFFFSRRTAARKKGGGNVLGGHPGEGRTWLVPWSTGKKRGGRVTAQKPQVQGLS